MGDRDHATFLLILLVFFVALNFQQSSPCSDTRHLGAPCWCVCIDLFSLLFSFFYSSNQFGLGSSGCQDRLLLRIWLDTSQLFFFTRTNVFEILSE